MQARFERCVSLTANQCTSSEIPPISMRRSSVSLQSPTVWISNRAPGVHKPPEACSGSPPSQRTETCGIFGRYANNWEEKGRSRKSIQTDQADLGRAWLCDQPGKITTTGSPVYRVSEFRCQLPLDVYQAAEIQGERNQEQAQAGLSRSPIRQLARIV